jgi:hypothetical protein
MPATRWGVYHNLKESEYVISNTEITFSFSSEHLLNKFMTGHENNRKDFFKKAKADFTIAKLNLNLDTLADILFYKLTEKRGFLARIKGVDMSWQDLEKYALRKMTEKNTPSWSRIPKPKSTERLKMWVDI